MRTTMPERLEAGRVRTGPQRSDPSFGANGTFLIFGPCGEELKIIASDGETEASGGWEHVSVSTRRRTPNWREMCFVKELFWDDEDCVVEFHPPRSNYVNNHEFCLHLWRSVDQYIPMPPPILVGFKGVSPAQAEAIMTIEAPSGGFLAILKAK